MRPTHSQANNGDRTRGDPRRQDIPEIYSVQRGLSGWTLSRRSLLSAAAAAAVLAFPKRTQAGVCAAGAQSAAIGARADSLAVSPDGRMLASASDTGETAVRLWSLPDGALLQALTGNSYFVYSLAISPDGTMLASACNDGAVRLWPLPGMAAPTILTSNASAPVAFSPDGAILASGGNNSTIQLWSLPNGVLLRTLTGHTSGVTSVAISPDGTMLASGSLDLTTRLWRLSDGALLTTFGNNYGVLSVGIGPDGNLLASANNGGFVKLYSLPDGALLAYFRAHTSAVNAMAISPDGRLLASCSADNAVKVWSLPDGAALHTAAATLPYSLVITPDGGLLVSGSANGIQLWTLPDLKQLPVCLMDPAVSCAGAFANTYTIAGVTYTVPAGSPIPSGAVCTCNTIQGPACCSVGPPCNFCVFG
jgi:sugar lactone lactonase YvrE